MALYYIQYTTKFTNSATDRQLIDELYTAFDYHYSSPSEDILHDYGIEYDKQKSSYYIMTLGVKAPSLIDAKRFVDEELYAVVHSFGLQFHSTISASDFVAGQIENVTNFYNNFTQAALSPWAKYLEHTTDTHKDILHNAEAYITSKYNEALSSKSVLTSLVASAIPPLDKNKFPYLKGAMDGVVKLSPSQARELARALKVSPIVFLEDNIDDEKLNNLKKLAYNKT